MTRCCVPFCQSTGQPEHGSAYMCESHRAEMVARLEMAGPDALARSKVYHEFYGTAPADRTGSLFNPHVTYAEFYDKVTRSRVEPPVPNTREYALAHFGARAICGPLTMPLGAMQTNARVWKPSASQFDFARGRTGRVMREDGMVGVLYDESSSIIQYSEEDTFAYIPFE